jgi:hypothetical protein
VLCGHSLGAALALIIGGVINGDIPNEFSIIESHLLRGKIMRKTEKYGFLKSFSTGIRVQCLLMNCPGIIYYLNLYPELMNTSINWCHIYSIGDHIVDLKQYTFPCAPKDKIDVEYESEIPLTTDGGSGKTFMDLIGLTALLYRHMSYSIKDDREHVFLSANDNVINACQASPTKNPLDFVNVAFPKTYMSYPSRITVSVTRTMFTDAFLPWVPTAALAAAIPYARNQDLERNYSKSKNPQDQFSALSAPHVVGGKVHDNTPSFDVLYQQVRGLIRNSNLAVGPKEDKMIRNEIMKALSKYKSKSKK